MAVSVTLAETLSIAEILTGNTVGVASNSQKTVTHSAFNLSTSLNSGTSPAVTGCAVFTQALTDGAATIDLTSMTGTNGVTVSANGTKVVAIMLKATATNTAGITVGEGASNGYELLGNAWKIVLKPSQQILLFASDEAPVVGSSAKTIDLAGTGTESLSVVVVYG